MSLIKNQKTYNLIIIGFVLVFSLFCVYKLQNIKFDYDFEAFFPNEDHELEIYNNYRKTFEYDNEFALVAVENKSGIFKRDFLLKIDSLTKKLSDLKYVQRVTSPTNLKTLSLGGLIPIQTSVLHFQDPDLYKDDSIAIYRSSHLIGSFFPLNAKSVSIYIKTDDVLTKKQCDSLAYGIEKSLKDFKFDKIHYVGRIFAQNVYLKNLQKEFQLVFEFYAVLLIAQIAYLLHYIHYLLNSF